jgi:CheY-like chemotaxis protein
MTRILVVEDLYVTRRIMQRMLESHSVQSASNGVEAMQILETTPIDILLVDIFMPEMGGLELIRRVRSQFPGTRIIAMTSEDETRPAQSLERATEAGADRGLRKPISRRALMDTVEALAAS